MRKWFIFNFILMVINLSANNAFAVLSTSTDTILVTATRLEQEGHRVAGNVTVITNNQIRESNAQSVPELLGQVEGVFISDFSTTRTSTIDIRGFGDTANRNVLVVVDGRRVNVVDSGAADLVQVPIDAIERIEIIRGASSVLYGDNAVGGVVNIITKKGEEGIHGKFGAMTDSYGTRGQHIEVSGREKKLSYYAFGKYLDKRGYRENADELYKDFNARLDFDATEKISFGVQYGWHKDSYELPGGLNQTEIVTLGRRGSADQGDVATTKDQYFKFTANIDPLPENQYLGHFVLDVSIRDRDLFDEFGAFNFLTNRDLISKGITGRYIYDHDILGRKVDFVTGIDFYEHENDILGGGSNSDDLTISRDDFGVYTNLQFETIDNLYVIGGSRYYMAEYTFDQRSGTPSFQKQKPNDTVSSAGLKYEYGEGSNIFFNFQQTFRFLTTNEWYSSFSGLNTALRQQSGEQYEVGIKHNFDGKAVVSVTPYWMETENEIFFDPSNGFFGANSNYDKIRRLGVEFGSRLDVKEIVSEIDFFDQLEFYTNYTFQNAEFRDGTNDGKEVPFVPNHQANIGFVAKFLEYYNVSLSNQFVGSRFAINDTGNNAPRAKAYFISNLNIAYERDWFEIFMKVNNMFDKEYETYHAVNGALTARDVFPSPERNFVWGVNLEF